MGLDGKLDEMNQRYNIETHKAKIKFKSKVRKGLKITRTTHDRPESEFGKVMYPEKLINWSEEDNEIDYMNRQIEEKNRINAEKQRIMDLDDDDVGDEVPNEPNRKKLADSTIVSNNKSSIILAERASNNVGALFKQSSIEMSGETHSPNKKIRSMMKGDPVYSAISKVAREAPESNKSPSKPRKKSQSNLTNMRSNMINESPSRYDVEQDNKMIQTQKTQPKERERSDSNKKQSKFHESQF